MPQDQVVLLNNKIDWIPSCVVECIAFVFHCNEIQDGIYEISGIKNDFFVRSFYLQRSENKFRKLIEINKRREG